MNDPCLVRVRNSSRPVIRNVTQGAGHRVPGTLQALSFHKERVTVLVQERPQNTDRVGWSASNFGAIQYTSESLLGT